MGRPVVHFELWSENPEKMSEFYREVFDWKINPIPELNYTMVETGGEGGINGGIMKPKQAPWPAKLTLYIDVEDLEPYLKKVTEAGGKILVEKMEVPGVGFLALFEDPDGRVIGLWQQGEQSA